MSIKKLERSYKKLCEGLSNGNSIIINNKKINVFEAMILKSDLEKKYGFIK